MGHVICALQRDGGHVRPKVQLCVTKTLCKSALPEFLGHRNCILCNLCINSSESAQLAVAAEWNNVLSESPPMATDDDTEHL